MRKEKEKKKVKVNEIRNRKEVKNLIKEEKERIDIKEIGR